MQGSFPFAEELQISLSPVGLCISFSVVLEMHSCNASPDDDANFLTKDVSLHSRIGLLSNHRELWNASGKSFQYT